MFRTTIKALLAHKRRLVTTSIAVLLGVAFMSGTFVLTDTIGKTFDDLFATAYGDIDAHVRGEAVLEDDFGQEQRPRIEQSVVETVQSVDGVAAAEGYIQGYAQIVGADGEPVGDPATGAPTFGANWSDTDELNPFTITDGRAPEAAGEVVVDQATLEKSELVVGDTTALLTNAGTTPAEIVGVARFGEVDSPAGASFVFLTTAQAQELVAEPGKFDAIDVVAEEGLTQREIADRIAAEVPGGVEVLTGQEITEEEQSALAEGLSFLNSFLLAFALIALFVGAFIIYNTFSILVAQRTKEMALLRAIGASRRQVLGSVLGESVVVGLVASIGGIVGGVAMAAGLQALFRNLDLGLPEGSLVLLPRTVVVGLLAGLLVTVLSAVLPARRASRVLPIAAMREVAVDRSSRSGLRIAIGLLVAVAGMGMLLGGLLGGGDSALPLVGAGAAITFIGIAVLGPVIAGPVSRFIGAPLPKLRGMTGTIARQNAMRNPRRTASTASALMIGVALVATITIFASSAKASVDQLIDESFGGDFIVNSGTFGGMQGGIPVQLSGEIGELPEVETATGIRTGGVAVDGVNEFVFGAPAGELTEVLDIDVLQGDVAGLGETGIAVDDETAREAGLSVGDTVTVTFGATLDQELTIGAVYDETELIQGYLLDHAGFDANFPNPVDTFVYIMLADGADPAAAKTAIEGLTDEFPSAELQDLTEFKDSQTGQIDQMLNLIYVLLALAVVIALIGIANTLALSIFERTRELGLLRAVGMTRGQMRSAVRWEAVIIALLGTVLGLVIGLFFGWSLFIALQEEGFGVFEVAPGQLAVVALLAALAGVAAAILPARRAAKLDVLGAIASE